MNMHVGIQDQEHVQRSEEDIVCPSLSLFRIPLGQTRFLTETGASLEANNAQ